MTGAYGQIEQLSLALRDLYRRFGYRQFKVGQFEEYDLYARNRNFLTGEHILTFSDLNGRLMALKPDVTLSIIKNTREDDRTRKLWYTENVYRVPRNAYGFQEIMQTGLECIGQVDLYTMAEVLMLAARSLEAITAEYALDLSHIGLLRGVLDKAGVTPSAAAGIVAAVGEKNLHALRSLCQQSGMDEASASLLERLCLLGGPIAELLPELLALPLPEDSRKAAEELAAVYELTRVFGDYRLNLDLSVTNDAAYYNGLVFRGFVDGAAAPVLSGGRYDNLLHRMKKTGSAIGFAVYLSELERFRQAPAEADFDVLLLYDDTTDPAAVAKTVRKLTADSLSVRVQPRGEVAATYKQLIDLTGKEGAPCPER